MYEMGDARSRMVIWIYPRDLCPGPSTRPLLSVTFPMLARVGTQLALGKEIYDATSAYHMLHWIPCNRDPADCCTQIMLILESC